MSSPAEPARETVAVGDLRTVIAAGTGGGYTRIGSATVNDSGVVAFAAERTSSAAKATPVITTVSERTSVELVRAGEPAPGGGTFATFGEVDLGQDGGLLFHARLDGCDAPEGLFLQTASGIREVARVGQACPTGSAYASFAALSLTSYILDSGPYFRLAYTARLADGRAALVIWPSYREPSMVLTTGEQVAGGVVEDFTISRVGFAVCVIARVRRERGPRHVVLLANEDQLIWGSRLRDGGRFAGLGRISRIMGPPGMNVHHGFVAAELEGGRTILTTCSGADPEVFACSGDPAPGMPDRHIARFGPPLANDGVPEADLCGIASVITLSDRSSALWLGVFGSQRPMAGAAIIPLVAGDHTDDQQSPVRVDTFTPTKLTNSGNVLLKASLNLGGRNTEGLLLLDRAFDWYRPSPLATAAPPDRHEPIPVTELTGPALVARPEDH